MSRAIFRNIITSLNLKTNKSFNRLKHINYLLSNTVILWSRYRLKKLPVYASLFLPAVYAASSSLKKPDIASLLSAADEFYNASKYKESYNVLAHLKDTDDDEVLWRLGRALNNMAQEKDVSDAEKKALIEEGYEIMQRALTLNDKSHGVHKYLVILLNAKTDKDGGTKAKIQSLPLFQHHILKAIELNPSDAMSHHMLGQFHYTLSDLSWIQKKLATTLFGTIPDTSFEDALHYLNKAEEASPNFYSKNLLLLGKTYLKLGMTDVALHWLQRTLDSDATSADDLKTKKEAADLLSTLKPK